MGRNQYWAGRVYDLCVYYMTGTPEGSTESGFMEKPGIELAIPGLQGIVLIHYTTGACVIVITHVRHMRNESYANVLVMFTCVKCIVNLRRSHINDKPMLQYRDVCDQMHLINLLFKEILCQVFRALSLFFDLLPFK